MSKLELNEFKWKLSKYRREVLKEGKNKELLKMIDNAGIKKRIDRLEAIENQINIVLGILAEEKTKVLENHLSEVYTDSMYSEAYHNALMSGKGQYVQALDIDTIQKAIKKSWASDGKNFSQRIWSNTKTLAREVSKQLVVNIATGKNPYELAQHISKQFDVDIKRASTLTYTETAAIRSQARYDSMKELEVEKYQIVATLDKRTSNICKTLDNKVFDLKDFKVGITAPPFHPNCRTSYVSYYEDLDNKEETRSARDKDNKKIDVPSNMSYEEWYDKYIIDKNEKNDIIKEKANKKIYNNFSDLGVEKIEPFFYEQKNYQKWENSLDERDKEVIKRYSYQWYEDYNKFLRGYGSHFEHDYNVIKKDVLVLEKTIKEYKTEKPFITYRGVRKLYGELKNLKIGDTVTLDNGFASSSLDEEYPFGLLMDDIKHLFKIKVNAGTNVGAFIHKFSEYDDEYEFLIKPRTKINIEKIYKEIKNGIEYIAYDVEVVE